MKRIYSTLIIVFACLMTTAKTHAQENLFNADGIYFNVTNDVNMTAEVTCGETKYADIVNIPPLVTYNDITYSVTAIGENAFADCDGLKEVIIPNTVKEIKSYAFHGCSAISGITVPASITEIGEKAFEGCNSLKKVYNFSQLTFARMSTSHGYIAYYADKVVNAANGTAVGDFIFTTSDGIHTLAAYKGDAAEITLPQDYNGESYMIGASAFHANTRVSKVIIPESVTAIGHSAFGMCTALSEIIVPNSVKEIGNGAFEGCHKLAYITLPASIETIEDAAFYNCVQLREIIIPNNVKSIGKNAFYNCKALKTIYNLSTLTFTKGMADNGFVAYYADDVVNAPNGAIIGDYVFSTARGVHTMVKYIGNAVEFTLPGSYNNERYNIGKEAFDDSNWYKSQPDGIVYIDNVLYKYKGSMPQNFKLHVKEGTVSIANNAFYGNYSLTCIDIANSVTYIGENSFGKCENLKTINNFSELTFSAGTAEHGGIALHADRVINVPAPNGEIIEDFVFSTEESKHKLVKYVGDAKDVKLPESYKQGSYSIGEYAFQEHEALESITITYNISGIEKNAFNGCGNIKKVINFSPLDFEAGSNEYGGIALHAEKVINVPAPNGALIDDFVFSATDGVHTLVKYVGESTEITLPASCNGKEYMLGADIFDDSLEISGISVGKGNKLYDSRENCNAVIESATNLLLIGCKRSFVPRNVIGIGGNAFKNCKGLEAIEIPYSMTNIDENAFYNCINLRSVTNFSHLEFVKGSDEYGGIALHAEKVINVPAPNGALINDFVFSTIDSVHTLVKYVGKEKHVGIPEDYKGEEFKIGEESFKNCITIESIAVPGSIKSFGKDAFEGCSALCEVHITDIASWCGIEFTNENANPLSQAKELYINSELVTELFIPGDVETIKGFTFCNCLPLTDVTVADGIKNIGEYAFYGCDNLENLYISNTIKKIGDYAFSECNNLMEIKVSSKKAITASSNVFSNDAYVNVMLFVPEGRKFAYERATPWKGFYIVEMNFTDIEEIKTESTDDGNDIYYDLSGRAVNSPSKGIYIKNGKTVIIR